MTVECQNVANNANATNTDATMDVETTNLEEEISKPKLPRLCTVCNCKGNFKLTKCEVLPINLLRTKQQFIVMLQVITITLQLLYNSVKSTSSGKNNSEKIVK